jgi:hypothetical protein
MLLTGGASNGGRVFFYEHVVKKGGDERGSGDHVR